MKWTAIYSDMAQADLDNMPDEIAKLIVLKVREIKKEPFAHLQKMRKYPLYKFRVRNYRCIVSISHRKLFINIVKIKHRNVAYRNL